MGFDPILTESVDEILRRGARDGAVVRALTSTNVAQDRHHMWVEFVVGSLLCSQRFFSGYSGFSLSSKTNICKLQFDQESGRQRTTLWMCYLFFNFKKPTLLNSSQIEN